MRAVVHRGLRRVAVEEVEEGTVLGHENMGIVEEVGPGVDRIRVGDRVSAPFDVACGTCRNCEARLWSFCLRTNPTPGVDGAAYGHANMARTGVGRPSTRGCRTPT